MAIRMMFAIGAIPWPRTTVGTIGRARHCSVRGVSSMGLETAELRRSRGGNVRADSGAASRWDLEEVDSNAEVLNMIGLEGKSDLLSSGFSGICRTQPL